LSPLHTHPLLSLLSLLFSIFLLRSRRPPTSTLFPYTTLFRSRPRHRQRRPVRRPRHRRRRLHRGRRQKPQRPRRPRRDRPPLRRSEEHTSELQSRENLVCRLLLEKKKKNKKQTRTYTRNSNDL